MPGSWDQTVLVVDDDAPTLAFLRQQFESRYQMLCVESAERALEILRTQPVDVLLTDQRLPGLSGLELVTRAREHQPDLVAIVLSAYAEPEDLLAAINEGRVYRYVRKPAHPAELAMTIHNGLEAAGLRKERDSLLERLQRRLDALSILYEVSAEAAAPRSYAQLVDTLTRALNRVVRFDVAASLIAKDVSRAAMHVHAPSACDEDTLLYVRDRTVELLSTLTGQEVGEADLLLDITGERVQEGPVAAPRKLLSSTHIPLVVDARVVGVIYLAAFREYAFSPDDEKLLYVLANQTSEAVRRLETRILEERRKMALMVESMADGVIMTDESGEVCLCNPAARRMLDIEPHIAVTTKYLKERLGFYPFDLVRGQAAKSAGEAALYVREEVRIAGKVLHSIVSPVRSGEGTVGVVVVLRDITERTELEQRKEEFISIVSHELRTPLTSITGALDIVLNNYPQAVGEKPRRYVQMAREGCARLGAIVDDLLDVAKFERGKVPLRPAPLSFDALAHDAVEKFRPAAEAKHIALELKVAQQSLRMVADGDRLTQVLNNLLSNALKFTPEGGRVEVEVFGPQAASTHVGLSIWNNGEPIPEDSHERVFDKFETAQKSPSRRVGGTGLGLAISRGIVEAHGGRIWVEPSPEGARFVVILPVSPPEETTPAGSGGSAPTQGAHLALVVSDRSHMAYLLKGLLSSSGRRVHIAQAADDGLAFAREKRPELIVLDMELQGGVAVALSEILKHDPETKSVPLLAIGTRRLLDRTPTRQPDGALHTPLDGETFVAYCEKLTAERGTEAPARILVCDDDPHIRVICREVLERAGYQVEEAPDGQAALEAIARALPDLLVLDVMMPELDGYQVLRRLKSEQATAELPVIFLSARGQTADKVRAFKIGAEDYLVKPFDHPELVMRVAKALERRAREASASPTTRLPGSAVIESETDKRLAARGDFAFVYVDLDNLKSFNDYYGYAKADGVIRQTGDILREVVLREGNPSDFVGHIAGDDFVVITTSDRVDRVCQTLIETFDRLIPLYYNRVDRERGYIETADRYGTLRQFPIMTVSVAALTSHNVAARDSAELATLAAEEKRLAKALAGSSYVRDGTPLWPPTAARAHRSSQ
ncbi:MAG TPA: response regulator [Polyangia bacterium]|nr:response regulator [Polyangia bacterium]